MTRTTGTTVALTTFTVDGYTTALVKTPEGEPFILATEGVGWEVPATGFKVNDFDPECPAWTLEEIEAEHLSGETVDLADFIRTFGSRLESNFHLWHRRLNG